MKTNLELSTALFLLCFSSVSMAFDFPTHVTCLTMMNNSIHRHEASIDSFGIIPLSFTQDKEWSFSADVIDASINSMTLTHLPTGAIAQSHATVYPLKHLHVSLTIQGKRATADCDLKY